MKLLKNNIIEKQQTTADSEVATWDNISNPKILSNTNGISSNHHPRNGSLPLPTLVTTTAQNKCNLKNKLAVKKRKTVVQFHAADLTQCMSLQTPQFTTNMN